MDTTIIEFDIRNKQYHNIPLDQFKVSAEPNKLYWIHCNLSAPNDLAALHEQLNLSEDVLTLCYQNDIMPKLFDSDENLTLQMACLLQNKLVDLEARFTSITMHLTDKFCFTAAKETPSALIEFTHSHQKAIRYAKTPCFIFFLIFDNIINDYANMLFNFELIVDDMDAQIRRANQYTYNDVMNIKQEVMQIKRNIIAARDMLMRLSSRNIAVISEHCRVSLSNLSSNSQMVVHESDSLRDVLNGMLDQIDNALMQKMNETMKVLTAVAAIFLPLTLITGIYGMNFEYIPELSWRYGYFWALGLILTCAIAMLIVFKIKKWF